MHSTIVLLVGVTAFASSCLAEPTIASGQIFQGQIVGGPNPIITQTPVIHAAVPQAAIPGPLTIGITNMYGHEREDKFGNDLFVGYEVLAGYPAALGGAVPGTLPAT